MDGSQRFCGGRLLASQVASHHLRHPRGLADTTWDLEGTSLGREPAAKGIVAYLK